MREFKTIETGRLIVRPWSMSDRLLLKDLFHDEGFLTFLPEKYHYLKEDDAALGEHLRARIDSFIKNGYCKFPVFLKETNELIGTCGVGPFVYKNSNELEVGARFRKSQWTKGYGTEATNAVLKYLRDELQVSRVYAYILPDNHRSQTSMNRKGVKRLENLLIEGILHYLYVIYTVEII